MRIQINGEEREFPQGYLSLNELLETLSLQPQRIAVEVNKAIVPRSLWEKTTLKDGDQIEIVHFVGGGAQRKAERSHVQPRRSSRRSVCLGDGLPPNKVL